MDLTNLEIPALSIRDFVAETKGMTLNEFILKSETLKKQLLELPYHEGEELYSLYCSIEDLTAFIRKVNWELMGNCPTSAVEGFQKEHDEIIMRYFPNRK